jgi:hypothetical protein
MQQRSTSRRQHCDPHRHVNKITNLVQNVKDLFCEAISTSHLVKTSTSYRVTLTLAQPQQEQLLEIQCKKIDLAYLFTTKNSIRCTQPGHASPLRQHAAHSLGLSLLLVPTLVNSLQIALRGQACHLHCFPKHTTSHLEKQPLLQWDHSKPAKKQQLR